ncbi:TPA: hypothetical protein ENS27_12555 [bacterium]|nr:hypothetical protein [bacterium]
MKSSRKDFLFYIIIFFGYFALILSKIKHLLAMPYKSLKQKRSEGVYYFDKKMKFRKSQDNPAIKTLYKEFLEYPLSHRSHELLHTHYVNRSSRVLSLKKKNII